MNKLLLFMLIIMIMITMISMLIMLISKKSIIDMQKSTPFECGFNPMSYKRLPFSIHFFLIAVIFLIFDIEIIIIVPMIFMMKSTMLLYWLITSVMFIIILIFGLFHEWYNGMLNWTN
uniref:NADH-ubiquinone oxidoreductase chain 3 n=1 Tax=Cicadellinae sp. EMHAU-2015-Zz060410 TaxID=2036852 RepID=A0A343K1G7_9HEMI|nr:NADH dehydrogenase subunit 3 [Cicadellinae sp. EMHAU-2015-Zz060410]QUO99354.1 NADH dehydrogenase subunit 3 [Atkinsoniella grahami]QUO99367.1 NADH dehydrogenase subunit 3 [Atkinsoniella xanthonota]QZH44562.1 NADH dehydrogenase subunit 3 [Atkinsoniella xanthonota]